MAERTEQKFSPGIETASPLFVVAGRLRKVGFIFPGAGDISVPARALFRSSLVFADYYARAERILNLPITELVLNGPDAYRSMPLYRDLGRYIYNQADLAVLAQSPDYQPPELVTGEGAGFVNALVLAGSMSFEVGLRLIDQRAGMISQESGEAVDSFKNSLAQQVQEGMIKSARIPVVALTSGELIQEPWEIVRELQAQLTEKEDWELVMRTLRKRGIRHPIEIGVRGVWSKMRENPKTTAVVTAVAVTAIGLTGLAWRLRNRRS